MVPDGAALPVSRGPEGVAVAALLVDEHSTQRGHRRRFAGAPGRPAINVKSAQGLFSPRPRTPIAAAGRTDVWQLAAFFLQARTRLLMRDGLAPVSVLDSCTSVESR